MLEGLEITEIKLTELKEANKTFRIDSNFFLKEVISLDKKIKEKPHFFISENNVVSGPFGSTLTSSSYLSSGVPFIRIENIKNGFSVSKENMIYISEYDNNRLRSSQLFTNDLILSKVGNTIGFYASVDEEMKACNISENNIGIKLSDYTTERKHFILTYLNTDIGYKLTVRRTSGNAQPKLNVFDVSEIPIPIFSEDFEKTISKAVLDSRIKLAESKSLYAQAEDTLLCELGLKGWQPNNNNINVKTLKESFLSSGRLDAEYYQSKYDEMYKHLAQYECDTINNIVKIKKSVEPGSDAYQDNGIPFVRVSDVNKFGISEPNIFLSPDEFDLSKLRPKKDTILLSKDGSVGIAYKVDKDLDCITSGALLHLTVFNQDYNPDYLTLVLNSIIVKMQAERDANGAIIQHWKPSEIEQVIIPKLPMPIQNDISAKIQKSFGLKVESKRLLEEAKMMVEQEIEKGGE